MSGHNQPSRLQQRGAGSRVIFLGGMTMDNRSTWMASKSDVLRWEGQTYTGSSIGFGRLWLKSYEVLLTEDGLTPESVILDWREKFFDHWPDGSKPTESSAIIEPGVSYKIRIATPVGISLETGFVVISVTQDSFTLMTRTDHPFSGWLHFSGENSDGGVLVRTQALVRPRDPLWEIAFRLGILPGAEDAFWNYVLNQIAHRFSSPSIVKTRSSLVDPQIQLRQLDQVLTNRPARYGFGFIAAIGLTILMSRLGKMEQPFPERRKESTPPES